MAAESRNSDGGQKRRRNGAPTKASSAADSSSPRQLTLLQSGLLHTTQRRQQARAQVLQDDDIEEADEDEKQSIPSSSSSDPATSSTSTSGAADDSASIPASSSAMFESRASAPSRVRAGAGRSVTRSPPPAPVPPSHNRELNRFEMVVGDDVAFIEYAEQHSGSSVVWNAYETFVPAPLRRRGLAGRLCDALFAEADKLGVSVAPSCTFIKDTYLSTHPQHHRLIHRKAASTADRTARPSRPPSPSPVSLALAAFPYASLLLPKDAPLPSRYCPLPHHPILGRAHFPKVIAAIALYRASPPTLASLLDLFSALCLVGSHSPEHLSLMQNGLEYLLQRVLSPEERQQLLHSVVPFTLQQIEELPLVFPTASLPLLVASSSSASESVHLSKKEVAVILSCSLFSMHAESKSNRFPVANFHDLFASIGHVALLHQRAQKRGHDAWDRSMAGGNNNIEKLRCMLHYFHCVAQRPASDLQPIITFHRHSVEKNQEDVWMDALSSTAPLPELKVFSTGTIEDDLLPSPSIHLDFANKYIGGGVLGHGCVQEEILFSICAECLASLLFCERMDDNEALVIIGAERFASYTGYGNGFRFAGAWEGTEAQGRDELGRQRGLRAILAIDAIPFRKRLTQWTDDSIGRELLKAYAGFSVPLAVFNPPSTTALVSPPPAPYSVLSTGNWGCGAFNGDVPLKAFIQLIAAALSHRSLRYFTFGDRAANGLAECVDHVQQQRVSTSEAMKQIALYARRLLKKDINADATLLAHFQRLTRNDEGRLVHRTSVAAAATDEVRTGRREGGKEEKRADALVKRWKEAESKGEASGSEVVVESSLEEEMSSDVQVELADSLEEQRVEEPAMDVWEQVNPDVVPSSLPND